MEIAIMNSNNMQSIDISGVSNFRFSAVRPDDLGATEYTLVTIVVDASSSVDAFQKDLRAAVVSIIESCKRSARAGNLLVRLVSFNNNIIEEFGFKTLSDIDVNQFTLTKPDGMTALFDASFEAIAATEEYARILDKQDYDVNAAVYVITDGADNKSRVATARKVAERVGVVRKSEALESIITLLIGVNTNETAVRSALGDFTNEGKFDQYVDVGDATADQLAKLAGFVSRSISSQSQALGSGAPSQRLSF
jgi:hypothetical protein